MRRRRGRYYGAAEIAKVAFCERKVRFDALYGDAADPEIEQRRQAGERIHQALARPGGRSGCFVASAVYGPDAPQTALLRQLRDRRLRRSRAGRAFIALYYRLSPPLARWLAGAPLAAGAARVILDLVALPIARMLVRKGWTR
ncbi:MAG: CFI-box-CTERM domain-containing protein [Sutterellaceae bacterium]|nr:hypothetical protein [Burkholderiaceae bacterium]MDW8429010.1 CFI-box-CTERM domain-containing protein [Sutterellaceae bacterium]